MNVKVYKILLTIKKELKGLQKLFDDQKKTQKSTKIILTMKNERKSPLMDPISRTHMVLHVLKLLYMPSIESK